MFVLLLNTCTLRISLITFLIFRTIAYIETESPEEGYGHETVPDFIVYLEGASGNAKVINYKSFCN